MAEATGTFMPTIGGLELYLQKGEAARNERAVRQILNTSIQDGSRALKTEPRLFILREAWRRETDKPMPRVTMVKLLDRQIRACERRVAAAVTRA